MTVIKGCSLETEATRNSFHVVVFFQECLKQGSSPSKAYLEGRGISKDKQKTQSNPNNEELLKGCPIETLSSDLEDS